LNSFAKSQYLNLQFIEFLKDVPRVYSENPFFRERDDESGKIVSRNQISITNILLTLSHKHLKQSKGIFKIYIQAKMLIKHRILPRHG
jgi:hypothetical protein